MYADKMTDSMKKTIEENNRRRDIHIEHNREHNITPQTIVKSKEAIMEQTSVADRKTSIGLKQYDKDAELNLAADPVYQYMTKDQIEKAIEQHTASMKKAAKDLDFIEAARFRDEIAALKKLL